MVHIHDSRGVGCPERRISLYIQHYQYMYAQAARMLRVLCGVYSTPES